MYDDFQRPPRRRNAGHPIRGFRESHPTFVWTVVVLILAGGLIFLTAHRFLH
jgi:hypothetical protein